MCTLTGVLGEKLRLGVGGEGAQCLLKTHRID